MNFGNSFTDISQGERLIELGLPIDSCDCIYALWSGIDRIPTITYLFDKKYSEVMSGMTEEEVNDVNAHPCWSISRLIDILCICYQTDMRFRGYCRGGMVESLINTYENLRCEIDFSKLED